MKNADARRRHNEKWIDGCVDDPPCIQKSKNPKIHSFFFILNSSLFISGEFRVGANFSLLQVGDILELRAQGEIDVCLAGIGQVLTDEGPRNHELCIKMVADVGGDPETHSPIIQPTAEV